MNRNPVENASTWVIPTAASSVRPSSAASPTLAGKHIYLMDNQGHTVIIEPGRTYKEVARNSLQDSTSQGEQIQNVSTPVFEGTRMYYRTPTYLYCIGSQ